MNISYFFIFCVAPILILNYLSLRAQKKFINICREKGGSEPLFAREVIGEYAHNHQRFVSDIPGQMNLRFKIFFGKFKDKELNKAAREVRIYFIAMIFVLLINFIILTNSI